MRKQASLPVRLDTHMSERLDAIAIKLHLTKSAVIRMVAEAFVVYWDEQQGRIVMPPEFKTYDFREKTMGSE